MDRAIQIRPGQRLLRRFQGKYACEGVMLHSDTVDVTRTTWLKRQIQTQAQIFFVCEASWSRCSSVQAPFIGERFQSEQDREKPQRGRRPFDSFCANAGLARCDQSAG